MMQGGAQMLGMMIGCFLAACGVLLLLWCAAGRLLLPVLRQTAVTLLPVRGDAGALEQAVRAWRQLAGGGLSTRRLLVVDCGLDDGGRALARALCAQDEAVQLCAAEHLEEIVKLGFYHGGTAARDDPRHGAERDLSES